MALNLSANSACSEHVMFFFHPFAYPVSCYTYDHENPSPGPLTTASVLQSHHRSENSEQETICFSIPELLSCLPLPDGQITVLPSQKYTYDLYELLDLTQLNIFRFFVISGSVLP